MLEKKPYVKNSSFKGSKDNKKKKKVCYFTENKVTYIDFTDISLLKKFISPQTGKILPRRTTGTCAKYQRPLRLAILRARHMALLPFVKD
jgi:small subunit ribosomal protein S18